MKREIFISVDIEADGPIPGDYSMSSLGACVVGDPETGFYLELQPISDVFVPEAMSVSGLDRSRLISDGADPRFAMEQFADWLHEVCGTNGCPIFVGLNAPFDWMFVHWYFIHFLGENPFGISAWDIEAYYLGVARKYFWIETSKGKMDKKYLSVRPHTHNALDDAREQAEIFQKLRREAGAN